MIEKYNEFVIDELDEFNEDIETSKKRVKLLPMFTSTIEDVQIPDTFTLGEVIARFKPKVKQQNSKRKTNKGIF